MAIHMEPSNSVLYCNAAATAGTMDDHQGYTKSAILPMANPAANMGATTAEVHSTTTTCGDLAKSSCAMAESRGIYNTTATVATSNFAKPTSSHHTFIFTAVIGDHNTTSCHTNNHPTDTTPSAACPPGQLHATINARSCKCISADRLAR